MMRINEIIGTRKFKGSVCTKDCSGHRAGYAWAQTHPNQAALSRSPSFNKGAAIAQRTMKPKPAQPRMGPTG